MREEWQKLSAEACAQVQERHQELKVRHDKAVEATPPEPPQTENEKKKLNDGNGGSFSSDAYSPALELPN